MSKFSFLLPASAALALVGAAGCSGERAAPPAASAQTGEAPDLPAGRYTLEKSHASLLFRADHLGFSMYTARFTRFDATLDLDPAKPEAARLEASVDVSSLETDFPYPEMEDFNATLTGPQWLDAAAHPAMRYVSKRVERTGPNAARIVGDLTLRGVTREVALDATFNGGYRGFAPYDPNARIGFSAKGELSRSAFGISYGVPTPESPLGVGDKVEIILEVEFSGPPLQESP